MNYKGGVGKTTTTYHIGCGLAMYHGKRVLLIDNDPQTNLTFLCASLADWKKQLEVRV
jgi:chromosome partitioning protein